MEQEKERPLAVVLLSGGMDSAVAASMTATDRRLACLHATYGQRTANRERVSFGALAHFFKAAEKQVVHLSHLGRHGRSSLTDHAIDLPEPDLQAAAVPSSYVPFRNAHLLAMAVSWAEILGADEIVIGAVEEDSSGYPDCSAAFYKAFQEAVQLGTRPETRIRLVTPVIGMSKADIVRRGQELGTPFNLTWSCYRDEDLACGRCDSCALRLRGFAGAGAVDPLRYADAPQAADAVGAQPAAAAVTEPAAAGAAAASRRRQVAALSAFLQRVRQA